LRACVFSGAIWTIRISRHVSHALRLYRTVQGLRSNAVNTNYYVTVNSEKTTGLRSVPVCRTRDLADNTRGLNSHNAIAVLRQRLRAKIQAETRCLFEMKKSIRNARWLLEKLGLKRIPFWIGKRLNNAACRTRGDNVCMNKTVMVWRNLNMIEFSESGEFATLWRVALAGVCHHSSAPVPQASAA